MKQKLARASADISPPLYGNVYPTYLLPGAVAPNATDLPYHEVIRRARFFYENDTIAGTVIDRIADIGATGIRNKHRKYADEIKNYYDGIAASLGTLLKTLIITYLIDGMAVAEYRTDRIMGNRIHQKLGRTRYYIPKSIWVRNNNDIELKKGPTGERIVYLRVPAEDVKFIRTKGVPDRVEEYNDLLRLYPEYVSAVESGKRLFRLDTTPIMRRLTAYNLYPLPYLKRVLGALEYRRALKRMDKITSDRVIASLRHISIGNDEYPADDDDITAAKQVINAQTASNQDALLNVYTNHTIKIAWVVPPMENLLAPEKFVEANADIFLGMGFPRLWAIGENERSNSADNTIAAVGPIAMINSMREDILEWIRWLYADLAEKNGFTQYPEPSWSPINIVALGELLQYAANFLDTTISRDTVARMYGSSFDDEYSQMEYERQVDPPKTQTPNEVPSDNKKPEDNPSGMG